MSLHGSAGQTTSSRQLEISPFLTAKKAISADPDINVSRRSTLYQVSNGFFIECSGDTMQEDKGGTGPPCCGAHLILQGRLLSQQGVFLRSQSAVAFFERLDVRFHFLNLKNSKP